MDGSDAGASRAGEYEADQFAAVIGVTAALACCRPSMRAPTHVGDRCRAMFNVVISNVPGPHQPLYFNGARLEQWYPVSLMGSGQALNITALSYADQMNLTFTACGTTLPHVQDLALHRVTMWRFRPRSIRTQDSMAALDRSDPH